MAPEVLVFSKLLWDRMDEEDQALIRQATKESVPYMRKLWDERETKARQTVEAGGARSSHSRIGRPGSTRCSRCTSSSPARRS